MIEAVIEGCQPIPRAVPLVSGGCGVGGSGGGCGVGGSGGGDILREGYVSVCDDVGGGGGSVVSFAALPAGEGAE
tara:strand:+ start:1136 stop:1360 length:225 start_codon:yes stop_codon:yes gene_type:complete